MIVVVPAASAVDDITEQADAQVQEPADQDPGRPLEDQAERDEQGRDVAHRQHLGGDAQVDLDDGVRDQKPDQHDPGDDPPGAIGSGHHKTLRIARWRCAPEG